VPSELTNERFDVLTSDLVVRRGHDSRWPPWAQWNRAFGRPYTIGVEEEVMLLDGADLSLAQCSEDVYGRLSDELAAHTSLETHAAVIELCTGVHAHAAGAVAELAALRARLAGELGEMGLVAASAGTYPLACPEIRVSGSQRYQAIADSMRSLARREPTLALHVHVGVPDPDDAVRLLGRLRAVVPLLVALSANSPFAAGRDSGFCSARTVIFQGFPRTGLPRRFADYADYVAAVDGLLAPEAVPDPSFLWWDLRLQPRLGTVEVRAMDAQTSIAETAALVALVRSLARLALERDDEPAEVRIAPEALAENRFLAARDGLEARLIDPAVGRLAPARALLDTLVARCQAHADPADAFALDQVMRLAMRGGAAGQRALARDHGLEGLAATLARRFAASSRRPQPAPA
jgi:glutamate---cysteine ligase / carboxylate-amine ligase